MKRIAVLLKSFSYVSMAAVILSTPYAVLAQSQVTSTIEVALPDAPASKGQPAMPAGTGGSTIIPAPAPGAVSAPPASAPAQASMPAPAAVSAKEAPAKPVAAVIPAPATAEVSSVAPVKNEAAAPESAPETEAKLPRPVAIMVENEPPARPQSGLFAAKVLYEIQAEEITRFMAVYYDLTPDVEVGPIRSARHYFADLSTMFGAVYTHVGGSPMGLEEIKDRNINNINAIKGDHGFYRTKERHIPHNLYIKLPSVRKEMERKKFAAVTDKALPFSFHERKVTPEEVRAAAGGAGRTVKKLYIPYMKSYRVAYEFDEKEGRFVRHYNDAPFRDYRTGATVMADNVVVMRCNMRMIDQSMRHDMDLYEGGTCEVAVGNHFFIGTWDRDRKSGIIKYFDPAGNEVKFNPGNIMIHVLPPAQTLSVDGENLAYGVKKNGGAVSARAKKSRNSAPAEEEVEEHPPF